MQFFPLHLARIRKPIVLLSVSHQIRADLYPRPYKRVREQSSFSDLLRRHSVTVLDSPLMFLGQSAICLDDEGRSYFMFLAFALDCISRVLGTWSSMIRLDFEIFFLLGVCRVRYMSTVRDGFGGHTIVKPRDIPIHDWAKTARQVPSNPVKIKEVSSSCQTVY